MEPWPIIGNVLGWIVLVILASIALVIFAGIILAIVKGHSARRQLRKRSKATQIFTSEPR